MRASQIGFIILSCIAVIVCVVAGVWFPLDPLDSMFVPGPWKVRLLGGWPFVFHVLMCGVAVAMVIVFPRELTPAVERGLIMLVSVICRIVMYGHPHSGALFNFVGPDYAWAGKLLVLLADCLTIWIILQLLERRGMSSRWSFLYALHPLVLSNFAAHAYPHAIILFSGCALVLFCDRRGCGPADQAAKRDIIAILLNAIGILLMLVPTARSMHVTWLLPLLAVRPTAPWFVLSLTTGLALMIRPGEGHAAWNTTLRLLEWAPVYVVCVREFIVILKRSSTGRATQQVSTVAVVIPARNEAKSIGRCVDAAMCSTEVEEVIVVDGGSTDDTVDRAMSRGARVVHHDVAPHEGGGRGGQIAAGLAVAHADVVAIVHADTQIPGWGPAEMCRVLNRQPDVIGGALGCIIDGRGWRYQVLNAANDFRAALLGVSFGDQVQFFRRRPITERSRFPAIPLMEDVELSKRMTDMGRHVFLFGVARVSPRSWEANGAKRAAMIICLVATYLLKRLVGKPDALRMYQRYYGKRD